MFLLDFLFVPSDLTGTCHTPQWPKCLCIAEKHDRWGWTECIMFFFAL